MQAALLPVLLVRDVFHPIDDLAVELFLNGDVRDGASKRPFFGRSVRC